MGEAASRAGAGVVAWFLPIVLFPLTWWVIGDRSESAARDRSDLSFLVEAPDIAPTMGWLLVVTSAIGGLALSISLYRTIRRCRPGWAALLMILATWLVAFGWGAIARTLAAGANGANMNVLVIPLVPVLLALHIGVAVGAGVLARPLLPEPEPANEDE